MTSTHPRVLSKFNSLVSQNINKAQEGIITVSFVFYTK